MENHGAFPSHTAFSTAGSGLVADAPGWPAPPAICWDSISCFLRCKGCLGLLKVSWGQALGGWVGILSFLAALLFAVLAYRWLKARLLWRLRNRLIVTYVFIGVIPVVLVMSMASITIYLFAGQFANFVVTSELDSRLRSLQSVNAAIAHELAAQLEHGQPAIAESLEGLKRHDPAWASRQICAWKGGKTLAVCNGATPGEAPFALPASLNLQIRGHRTGQRPALLAGRDRDWLRVAEVDRGLERTAGPEIVGTGCRQPGRDHALYPGLRSQGQPVIIGRTIGGRNFVPLSRRVCCHRPATASTV